MGMRDYIFLRWHQHRRRLHYRTGRPLCRQSPLEGLSQVRPTDEEEPHEMNQKGGAAASSMRPALVT
jgi:hypothetical protein